MIRPTTFDEIIGNEDSKALLKESIKSSKSRNVKLDHIFLAGPSGCGKSTFADAIAHEMHNNYEYIMCGNSNDFQTIIMKLMNLKDGDILFLDEVHSLSTTVLESIYDYLQNGNVSVKYGTTIMNVEALKVTIICATTELQMIPVPFIGRFPIQIRLTKYTYDQLAKIIILNSPSENVNMNYESALEIAKASKGTPRIATQYLKRIRDHLFANNLTTITPSNVNNALKLMGIDSNGLDTVERNYIIALFDTFQLKPTGVSSLCAAIGEHEKLVTSQYEPSLMTAGLILKTPSGRVLTPKGMKLAMVYKK
jgi:Holliday junction DNA helicase RuvB